MVVALSSDSFAIVVCFEDASRERFVLARHEDRGWEIPGGRIEPGEDPVEAGVREFREETGHDVVDPEPVLETGTPEGVCHVVAGRLGPAIEQRPGEEDAIEGWQLVEHLGEVDPLAFPEDPYEAIEQALGVRLRAPKAHDGGSP